MRRYIVASSAALVSLGLFAAASGDTPPRSGIAQERYEDDHAGQTAARLDYTEDNGSAERFFDVRLRIVRGGSLLLDRHLGPICEYCSAWPVGGAFANRRSIRVRDLDRDGEAEVVVDFYWGGAHCCFYSYVASFTGSGYALRRKTWGDLSYALQDLKGDGLVEFRARDRRFSYALNTSFADSWWPIQIWNFRRGALVDATRRHRAVVAVDAARLWRRYRRYRGRRQTNGVLAAYLADTYSLGRGARGWRRVRRAVRSGGLRCSYCPRISARRYLRSVRRFLRRTGYIR